MITIIIFLFSNKERSYKKTAPKRLSELEVKGSCQVVKLTGSKATKKRQLKMGFIQGTEIYVEKVALCGNPNSGETLLYD